ncbi:hypothetical protein BGZ82_010919 [Podila clonocystis]|nr:hypothetical protein BGZ82_010919 [Podila clonocystis]
MTSVIASILFLLKNRIQQGPKTRAQKAGWFALLSFVLLLFKYPNRAIGTSNRPDLNDITWKGMPLVGNTITILRNRNRFLSSIVENFEKLGGSIMSTTLLGLGRVIAINDPVLLEHILKTNFENYEKGYILNSTLAQVLGNGIFNSDGALWKMHRKTASHVFSTKIYRALIDGAFTTHSLQLCTVLDRAAEEGRPGNKMKQAVAVIDSYAYDAIQKRRHETTDEAARRLGSTGREDLLDLFMKWRDDDGQALDDTQLRDVFINFIIAGRDTTAQALSWMYYEVMKNPAVENNIWAELANVSQPTYESLTKEMRYSNAVFMEALRLYPPVPRNLKTAVADDVLPNGVAVQRGDRIMFSTYAIGRNRAVWGPQAPEFLPERWFEGNAVEIEKGMLSNTVQGPEHVWPKVRKESQFKFSSFNAGPRICLGQTFATLEALTVIHMISSRFQFRLVPGQEVPEPVPSLTLPMKNPLMVHVIPRK